MTSRYLRILLTVLVVCVFLPTGSFGQGSKMQSPGPIEEADRDRPDKRAAWRQRGRSAPPGQSAAALRLRAHRQKMAMRAQRAA
ncbi:MAG: hypothetical protein WAQ52_11705, partial [Terriglobales bacterium]